MNSEILMARSKGYTNMVALGLSNVAVNNKTGVVTFELNDGSSASYTFPKPKDGVSVTGVSDKGDGTFTLLLSDGSETSAVQTIKGDPGANGYTPVKGTDYWTNEDISEIQSYIDTQIGGALNGSY